MTCEDSQPRVVSPLADLQVVGFSNIMRVVLIAQHASLYRILGLFSCPSSSVAVLFPDTHRERSFDGGNAGQRCLQTVSSWQSVPA